MRLISFLLLFIASPCLGEIFYYGDRFLTVDLRSDQPSVLRFESVPLSSACQPGVLGFEPLDPKALSLGESQQVQANTGERENDQTITQLLRVNPQDQTGVVICSFTLAGGEEVPIRFNLTPNIARPFLDFRPIADKYTRSQVGDRLALLQSLVKGESTYLHDITKDFETCPRMGNGTRSVCRKLRHSTDIADYELIYAGTDKAVNGWVFLVDIKVDRSFFEVADLNAKHGGHILYSTLTPQRPEYVKGRKLMHYVLTSAQATQLEVLEVLP